MPSGILTFASNTLARKVVLFCLAAAFLGGLVLLTYGQRQQAVFVLDDLIFILGHPGIRSADLSLQAMERVISGASNRPLPFVSFFVDWHRSEGNPEAFYRTNVVLHYINALLVLLLARKILLIAKYQTAFRVSAIALVAAGLWTVHPIHMNAVAYISQRMTSMAALFVFSGLLCFLNGRMEGNPGRRAAYFGSAMLLWLVAFFCKENAVIAPFIAVLLELGVVRNHSPTLLRHPAEKWMAWLMFGAVIAAVLDLVSGFGPISTFLKELYSVWDFTLEQRLLTQPRVLLFHLSQLFWPAPSRFSIEHDISVSTAWDTPTSTLPAMLLLGFWLALGAALLLRRGQRLLGALLLFPLVGLSVESSIIPIDMIFEHRMYLPSFSLFILASIGIFCLPTRIALISAGILLVALAACQIAYLSHWSSRLTIYERAASQAPTSIRVQYNYANALVASGRHQDAIAHYRLALSAPSPSVNQPGSIHVSSIWLNLGLALLHLKRLDEARQSFETVVQLQPDHLKAHAFLADIFRIQRNEPGTRRHLEHVLRLDPANSRVREMLFRLTP